MYILRRVTATSVIQVVNNHYSIEGYKEKIFCHVLQFCFFFRTINIWFVPSQFLVFW